MKVISVDIGIKNLAYTIIDHNADTQEVDIIKWDIINLCNVIPKCSMVNCKNCAKFTKDNIFYCKKHIKNVDYKIPTINIKTLSKQNIKFLKNVILENEITNETINNKSELIKCIEDYTNTNFLDKIDSINANDINLIDLGINLKTEFNKLFESYDINSIDMILLENQISPIANRMKTIQGMLAQYFINNNNYNIQFISAANKLKLFIPTSQKTTYNERKKLSILYCKELLFNKNLTTNLEYFNKHTKKDDLADCLLQGIHYLHINNKLKL